MQPDVRPMLSFVVSEFQSSPGQKAGCNRVSMRSSVSSMMMFQSSPGQKAGCNDQNLSRRLSVRCFNPHPARRPGATSAAEEPSAESKMFQSSPGQKAGCNRHSLNLVVCLLVGFNPHPARRPGATRGEAACQKATATVFQSSPGQKAGCNGDVVGIPYGVVVALFQSSPGQKAGCNACI